MKRIYFVVISYREILNKEDSDNMTRLSEKKKTKDIVTMECEMHEITEDAIKLAVKDKFTDAFAKKNKKISNMSIDDIKILL